MLYKMLLSSLTVTNASSVFLTISIFLQQHTFRNFQGISELLSEVSKLQHHTKLCPGYSTLLVSS